MGTFFLPPNQRMMGSLPIGKINDLDIRVKKLETNPLGGGTWGSITGTLSAQTDLQSVLDGKIPYTGATNDVDLGTHKLTANSLTAWNGNTYSKNSLISQGVGYGNPTAATSISDGDKLLTFYVPNLYKTSMGAGMNNEFWISTVTPLDKIFSVYHAPDGTTTPTEKFYVNKDGGLNASYFIKSGGTSSQFLKADGSVDSTTYNPLISGDATGVFYASGSGSPITDIDYFNYDDTTKTLNLVAGSETIAPPTDVTYTQITGYGIYPGTIQLKAYSYKDGVERFYSSTPFTTATFSLVDASYGDFTIDVTLPAGADGCKFLLYYDYYGYNFDYSYETSATSISLAGMMDGATDDITITPTSTQGTGLNVSGGTETTLLKVTNKVIDGLNISGKVDIGEVTAHIYESLNVTVSQPYYNYTMTLRNKSDSAYSTMITDSTLGACAFILQNNGTGSLWVFGQGAVTGGNSFQITSGLSPSDIKMFIDYSTGKMGIGTTNSTPASKFDIQSTTEQLRLRYDSNHYLSTTVSSTGGVTFDAVGSSEGFTFADNVKATGYKSGDGSDGISTTITTASLVGKTITIKNGLITGFV